MEANAHERSDKSTYKSTVDGVVRGLKADDLRALAEWVQKNGGPALEGLKAKATAASEQADKPEEPVDVSEEVEKKDK